MRTLGGIAIALLAVGTLAAQNRAGFVNTPGVTRTFGSVVFPGGTSAMPGIQRTTPNVLYPGGGGPQIGIPAPNVNLGLRGSGQPFGGGGVRRNNFGGYRNGAGAVYAYPVYVGAYPYYDPSYYADPSAYALQQQQAQPQQQPNITIILPPQQAPVVIGPYGQPQPASPGLYQPQPDESQAAPAAAAPSEPTHYLLAFKDHTIYSAIAYWVDGDTLHYFTTGNTHNQVSLSLVDRDLTERLNRESGLEVKLPAAK